MKPDPIGMLFKDGDGFCVRTIIDAQDHEEMPCRTLKEGKAALRKMGYIVRRVGKEWLYFGPRKATP